MQPALVFHHNPLEEPNSMAMTARLWSISALAVELNMDRRTVGARLRGVRPDGKLHGSPAWLLPTALRALRVKGAIEVPPATEPPPPSGFEILADIPDPIHGGLTAGWLGAIYTVGAMLRGAAPTAGFSTEQSLELAKMATVLLIARAERELREAGVPPFVNGSPAWLNTQAFSWLGDAAAAEAAE
jgi:hypothetical protein